MTIIINRPNCSAGCCSNSVNTQNDIAVPESSESSNDDVAIIDGTGLIVFLV